MSDQVVALGTIKLNISPDGFHMWAQHYYKCTKDFISPHRFSPVPYFLICRSIELQLKAHHLKNNKQTFVKKQFGHDLIDSYFSLDIDNQILTESELEEVRKANDVYSKKGFEYFSPFDALRGYSNFPRLDVLIRACERLLGHGQFLVPKPDIRSSRFIDFIDNLRRWLIKTPDLRRGFY